MEQNKDQKLKDLEKSLAEELDQSIKSGNIIQTSGGGDNQTVTILGDSPGKEMSAVSGTPGEPEDVSIADLDKILNEQDPSFEQNLNTIQENLKTVEKDMNIESIDVFGEVAEPKTSEPVRQEVPEPTPKKTKKGILETFKSFLQLPMKLVENISRAITNFKEKGLKQSFQYLVQNLPRLLEFLKTKTLKALEKVQYVFKWFLTLRTKAKVFLLMLIGLLALILLYLKFLVGGQFNFFNQEPSLLGSFKPVADRVITFPPDAPMEDFDNPLRHPEYVVLLKKLVVNLKLSPHAGTKPFAAIELYLEANNQKAAVEIKDREKEVIDIIGRIAENMSYEEIASVDGKDKFRTIVRRDLNAVLNNGRVKKIYFKTIFYKP